MSKLLADDEHREQICAFLRANGIDPSDVPIDAHASIQDGQLAVEIYSRNGRMGYPGRWTVTVPLVVAPTGGVENWTRNGEP